MKYSLLLEFLHSKTSIKSDIINVEGRYYLVDTHKLNDKFETLIFRCDKQGNITDYDELDVITHDDATDAENNHNDIIKNKDRYIFNCLHGGGEDEYNEHL